LVERRTEMHCEPVRTLRNRGSRVDFDARHQSHRAAL